MATMANSTMANATSMAELKAVYRQLAFMHHPDRGGCSSIMQRVNQQYQMMRQKLKERMSAPESEHNVADDFSQLQPGTLLFVNSTPCEVLSVTETTFNAIAKTHNRQAVFCKRTGLGKYNRRIRASFSPINPPGKDQ
jgi:DnaJ-class molecular chaperone